jgi:NAD(P)-dependent dehydrogenase (short-subunit alcohol dehydrogenase family)
VNHEPGPLLAGRAALVTGGGGGIGRAISETFAAHGARVVVAEINPERAHETVTAIRAAGGEATGAVVDVGDEGAVTDLVGAVGHIDVLVNNVGHYLPGDGDFLTSTSDEWRALYRVNLEHVFLCTRAFVPGMVARKRGSVINVSSVEAFRAIPRRPVYGAFKGAVTQFTKSLAVELGNDGVRVNAIAPDLTETLQVPYSRWVPEEHQALIPQWVPVGRFGTPADIAGVALFLASDLAAFVTGTTIHADGGSLAAGGWFRRADSTWTNRPLAP